MARFKMYSNTNTLKLVFICIRIQIQYTNTPCLVKTTKVLGLQNLKCLFNTTAEDLKFVSDRPYPDFMD